MVTVHTRKLTTAWVNFTKRNNLLLYHETPEYYSKELYKFNARIYDNEMYTRFVEFQTEEDLTIFKLIYL